MHTDLAYFAETSEPIALLESEPKFGYYSESAIRAFLEQIRLGFRDIQTKMIRNTLPKPILPGSPAYRAIFDFLVVSKEWEVWYDDWQSSGWLYRNSGSRVSEADVFRERGITAKADLVASGVIDANAGIDLDKAAKPSSSLPTMPDVKETVGGIAMVAVAVAVIYGISKL